VETTLLIISSLVSVAIGGALSYLVTSNRDRTSTSLRLFRSYNEQSHHQARHRAAKLLTETRPVPTFNELWMDPASIRDYEDLWQIVYFWFELEWLARNRLLHRRLVRGLFAYPYSYWRPMLTDLARRHHDEATRTGGSCPDWCDMWLQDSLSWIETRRAERAR